MKFFPRTLWLVCAVAMLCSACGQKGRLVMPVRPAPVSTPYPTALPDDADPDSKVAPADDKKTAPTPASDEKN